jgi:glucose/arabinose dehydrogenase
MNTLSEQQPLFVLNQPFAANSAISSLIQSGGLQVEPLKASSSGLVFIDGNISNWQTLAANITSGAQIVWIDPSQDGLSQIGAELAKHANLGSIQIISHGQSGRLQLGNAQIDEQTLSQRSSELSAWAQALTIDADILLYGCNVALDPQGQEFVKALSQITGADVAASSNLTGKADLGGDWVLEFATGAIEARLPFATTTLDAYEGTLATFNYANFATTSGLQLNGNTAQSGNVLRLTPAAAGRVGSSFYTTPIAIASDTSFQTRFQFRLGGGQGTNGADGFIFMLQNAPTGLNALGGNGGNLGYNGIGRSLAIEFDTSRNDWDPNNNHISVLRDGNLTTALATANSPIDLNNNSLINAWVNYDGATDRLSVFLSTGSTQPTTATLSTTVDLAAILGSTAFVGFSAGTGGASNNQDIINWQFTSTTNPPTDTVIPTASVSAAVLSTAGTTPYSFTVTYTDNVAVNRSTIDSTDIQVTGPSGFTQIATLTSVNQPGNGTPLIATYTITAPGGAWDSADNGTYSIAMQPAQVTDTSGNAVAAATLGTFAVTVPTTPPIGGGDGLRGEYFDNIDFTNPLLTRTDATVNFNWGNGAPAPGFGDETFSVRWTGQVQSLYSETYTFFTTSDDGVRLFVNNQLVINSFINQSPTERSGTIALVAGQRYDIRLEYFENTGGAVAQLAWSSPTQAKQIIPQSQLFSSSVPTPGVTIIPSDGTTTLTESGATDTYNVVLNIAPTADVTVTLTNAGGQTTTSVNSLIFTPTNWNVPQTVTVTAVDDTVFEGPHTGTVNHSANSTDVRYNGLTIAPLTANITDNDTPTPLPGVTLVQTGGNTAVTEGGITDTYSLVLTVIPTADVTIALTNGGGQTTTSINSLTFTPTNWNIPQTVTVTAVDDTLFEGFHTGTVSYSVTSTDTRYGGLAIAPLTVAITDNEPLPPIGGGDGLLGEYFDNIDFTNRLLTRTDATVNFNWGDGSPAATIGADTFSVRWTGQVQSLYSETYTFFTTSDDGVRLFVNNQLVINSFINQSPTERSGTIALVAGQKYDIRLEYFENGGGAVAQLAWSSPTQAKQIIPQSQLFSFSVPTPGVTIIPSDGTTTLTEGGVTDTYSVVLNLAPTADVTIALNNVAGQTTTSVSSLTFTPTNWNVPQTVTVTAVDDTVFEGPHTGTVNHTATSTDTRYNGLTIAPLTANITDNDVPTPLPEVTLAETGGNTAVVEGGATDTYSLVLTLAPTADVTITLNNVGGQTTTSVGSLTFTPTNWNVPQTVTVTAVDDTIAEFTHSGTINSTVTSLDSRYNGLAIAPLTVGIADNDSLPNSGSGFSFTNFSDTSSLKLNGNAAQAGTALRLTPAANSQVGSAFFTSPIAIEPNTSFQTQFQFQLAGGTDGADGFVFMLQNSAAGLNALGEAGGSLGYDIRESGTGTRIDKSVAIAFDTFQTGGGVTDNTIFVFRDGDLGTPLATVNTGLPDLNGGSLLTAWVDYNGLTNRLEVYLSTSTVRPTTPTLSLTLDLVPILGGQAFVGFSAGTGGGFNAHDITSWTFASDTPFLNTFALKDNATIFVNESAGVATVTAVRTGSTSTRVALEYTTNEVGIGSAQSGADYTQPTLNGRANTGQVVFEIGEAEKSFTVPIINDTLNESNETFAIGIQNPSAGTLGAPRTVLITIVDDDSASTISLSAATLTVAEDVPTATLTLQRTGNVSGPASINFNTGNGTAIAGADYTATTGTINFSAGQTTQTITIPILNDTAVESNETFSVTLSTPTGAILSNQSTATVTILDNDLSLGTLTRQTVVSGLNQPTVIDWTPDGRYMLVAQKGGAVRVVDNGVLRMTPLIDLSGEVNDTRDRGLLGLAIHPNFATTPYVYLLYTYDPPETAGQTGLAGPDQNGNRPSRLVRVTVNPTTMIADPASLVVLAGTNSTWAYTSRPDGNSTGDLSILPSGIVNGTTITAPASELNAGTQDNDPSRPGIQNLNIRDYLATDSESHTIGAVNFGPDGMLYLTNGDGTSYNFADPRAVRVQDVNNLSGKTLRIDPITGQGLASNPFFNGDPNSNQSKVFYSGLRNGFRFAFDPVTQRPVIGDVGWNSWEEINTGAAGSNFGWPYLEGPNQTASYSSLPQAVSFYSNGNINPNSPSNQAAVFPILSRSHGAPDNANAIMVGDFYNSNTLMFGDIDSGTLYAATLDASRQVTNVQVFDSGIPFVVDMEMGPDQRLYGVNLAFGTIVRWNPGSVA